MFDALLGATGSIPDGNVTTCAGRLQSHGRRAAADAGAAAQRVARGVHGAREPEPPPPHTHLLPCGEINRDAGTNLPIKMPVRLLWVDINDNWQRRLRKG